MQVGPDGALTMGFTDGCPATREVLTRVGDTWSVLVIVALGTGTFRFNDLKRAIDGISQKMLTSTVRALERDGLVSRTVLPMTPPGVDYALTPLGRTLLSPLMALATWAQTNKGAIAAARAGFDADDDAADDDDDGGGPADDDANGADPTPAQG